MKEGTKASMKRKKVGKSEIIYCPVGNAVLLTILIENCGQKN
jgi:hypothetical protein